MLPLSYHESVVRHKKYLLFQLLAIPVIEQVVSINFSDCVVTTCIQQHPLTVRFFIEHGMLVWCYHESVTHHKKYSVFQLLAILVIKKLSMSFES